MALKPIGGDIDSQDLNDNFSDLQTQQETHVNESAHKHITESGTNANGEYIKFDDGTMICTNKLVSVTYLSADALSGTWTFPATFIDSPTVSANINTQSTFWGIATDRKKVAGIGREGVGSGTSANIRIFSIAGQSWDAGSTASNISAIAIGRWKA